MAAAAWSWVEKMLHEAQRTSAPRAFSVSIRTAVWMVMCSEPVMRAPRSGWLFAYSSRIAMRPGISVSAIAISLRPQSASLRSATWKSAAFVWAVADISSLLAFVGERRKRDRRPKPVHWFASAVSVAEPGPRGVAAPLSTLYSARSGDKRKGFFRGAGRWPEAHWLAPPGRCRYKDCMPEGIVVVSSGRIEGSELRRLVDLFFEDMVKYVVDVGRGVVAVGGEMHADGEQALLEDGSRQADLWGANYYPGRGREECIEYTALINIRPALGNRSMEIQDPAVRERVRELTWALIGEGEALP